MLLIKRINLFAAALLVTGAVFASQPLPQIDRVMVLEEARAISDATLTNQEGEPFRLSDLHGKVSLVFFGFTNCPDVCPTAMAKYKQLEDSNSVDNAKLNYILVSVDGDRDTPIVMKAYLRQFSNRIVGLSGPPSEVQKITKEFRASFFKESETGAHGKYNVAHSTQMFLLDSEGRLRAELHNPTIDAMARAINALSTEVAH